jgi:hypothetical protein
LREWIYAYNTHIKPESEAYIEKYITENGIEGLQNDEKSEKTDIRSKLKVKVVRDPKCQNLVCTSKPD